MATKKEDLLNQDTSGVDIPETTEGSVSGDLSAELPAVIQTDKDTGDTALDLNELLSSMDQQSETDGEALSSEKIMVNAAEDTTASEKESEGETPKPKPTSRKKETAEVSQEQMAAAPKENESDSSSEPSDKTGTEEVEEAEKAEANAPATKSVTARRTPRSRSAEAPVLTIDARSEVETEEEREDIIWHEIHNAYRTRRILTGQLGGVEQTDAGKTIAIVDYKGFRIIIPLKEMMINLGRMPSGQEYADFMLRQNKILGNMLGAEIDFIVMGD